MLFAMKVTDILSILNFAIFTGWGGWARPSLASRHSSPARPANLLFLNFQARPGLPAARPMQTSNRDLTHDRLVWVNTTSALSASN